MLRHLITLNGPLSWLFWYCTHREVWQRSEQRNISFFTFLSCTRWGQLQLTQEEDNLWGQSSQCGVTSEWVLYRNVLHVYWLLLAGIDPAIDQFASPVPPPAPPPPLWPLCSGISIVSSSSRLQASGELPRISLDPIFLWWMFVWSHTFLGR